LFYSEKPTANKEKELKDGQTVTTWCKKDNYIAPCRLAADRTKWSQLVKRVVEGEGQRDRCE